MSDSELPVGMVLHDTYVLTGQLGAGGMGVVYKAKHKRLPKQVAIKVLHQFVATDKDAFTRFKREAEIASRIDHPHIVQALDFNELDDGRPYLVLEFLRGQSLRDRIGGTPLPLEPALTIASQIASGLSAAHNRGIVHRDLKPENIFLSQPEGTVTPQVKILDFGISKLLGTQSLTQDGMMIGTPYYMSPEQAKGQAVDARTDQFALAAMVYEMLAGRPPFWGDQPVQVLFQVVHQDPPPLLELAPAVKPKLAEAINKGLAKKADARYPDVGSFALALWHAAGLKPPRDSMLGLNRNVVEPSSLDIGTGPTLPPLDGTTPAELGVAPTMVSPSTPKPAYAPTLDSQSAAPAPAQPATLPPWKRAKDGAALPWKQAKEGAACDAHPMRRASPLIGLLILVGLGVGGYFLFKGDKEPKPKVRPPKRAAAAKKAIAKTAPPATDAATTSRADAATPIAAHTASAPGPDAEATRANPDAGAKAPVRVAKKGRHGKKGLPKTKVSAKTTKRGAAPPPEASPPTATGATAPLSKALEAKRRQLWQLYQKKQYNLLLDRLRSFDPQLKSSQRWISRQLYVVAACGLEDLPIAKGHFSKLPANKRAEVVRLCKKNGEIDPR